MKIAALLNTHVNRALICDTIESIQTYLTKDILAVRDSAVEESRTMSLPVPSVLGFKHGCPRSPYRNVALGLDLILSHYDADWYCYIEYDCLLGSDRIIRNLEQADERKVWMLGACGRVDDVSLTLVERLVGAELTNHTYYLLGCCQFFSRTFLEKLKEINFFERFLHLTNQFSEGYMPGYTGYDLSEHLYPTLARYFGGNIGVLSTYQDQIHKWHGSYEYFPMRFRPELDPLTENFPEACIMHPLKDYSHPIRTHHREKRKNVFSTT